ncbi:MAG: NAD(P)-dependent glycerol-3-phosphate dehydrogenase [Bradyrhizobiaceae bacterium]|nr:NAD(P)-dependent glycerol-3-phosphate dehydrogenase [Bradyrhizobiaceae bacterium]
MSFDRIAILGAGAWGIALANAATRAGREVMLSARDVAATAIARDRESPRLPGVKLAADVTILDAARAAARADAVLLAIPAQQLRTALLPLAQSLSAGRAPPLLVACAKGIERATGLFMTEVIKDVVPPAETAILSGPSFAVDVARGLPTAVTLATSDNQTAGALARALGSATFRPYHSTDVRGVEIGGAAKNVLAIAAGIVKGRGLGASAAAALTTRGFAELTRFGRACGAMPETLTGLSGLGDLILTCSNLQSRNFSLGIAIGEGRAPQQAVQKGKLAEGAFTASILVEMATRKGIDMPISEAVAAVLEEKLSVDEAMEKLLTRPFKAEGE